MTLVKLEARNPRGQILSLPLTARSGFPIRGIDGLDPVKATLITTTFARLDGEQFHTSRRDARNIILRLGLVPDWAEGETVKALRDQLYQWFMTKSKVQLTFFDDVIGPVDIHGIVESTEAPLFTDDPQATISIMCHQPDFVDPDTISVNLVTTAGSTLFDYVYPGTVDTGFVFRLFVNRTMYGFTLFNSINGEPTQDLDFDYNLLNGDTVTVSTVEGDLYATLTRAGTVSDILYAVDPRADWVKLKQGTNRLRVLASGSSVPYRIDYKTRYGAL